jgi:hypothetical protein
MNPSKNPTPNKPAPQPQSGQVPATADEKKKGLSLDLKSLRKKLNLLIKLLGKHAAFAAILLVLIAYLFVVFKIRTLATAEPDAGDVTQSPKIPKIDKDAVQQIQQLEQSNTQVHSLFDAARNNPFQE